MDKIRIENLEIFAKHGVFPEENFLGQKFVLSAVLHTDTRKAGLTDELSYSVHYGEVSHLIKKVVEENTWKLLETVAEATAKAILLSYPMVSQVDLTIKKPWAPIGLPLDTVSVEISRGWHTAYIALGSNMGDKEKYLNEAVEKLQQTSDCQVLKVSDFLDFVPLFLFLLCWHNVFIICNIFHSSFHIFYHNSCLYGYLLYSIPHLQYSDLPPEAVPLHFLPLILVCGLLLTPIQNRHNVLQQLPRQ